MATKPCRQATTRAAWPGNYQGRMARLLPGPHGQATTRATWPGTAGQAGTRRTSSRRHEAHQRLQGRHAQGPPA
eukprot:220286-Chlamydomonas_euryale.AAC.1